MRFAAFSKFMRVSVSTCINQFYFIFCTPVFADFFLYSVPVFVAEKEALEKRVKELEESLALQNTEAEKVAKDTAAREAEFVNRAAFLTQNVRGKIFCMLCPFIRMYIGLCLLLFHCIILFRSGAPSSTFGFVK